MSNVTLANAVLPSYLEPSALADAAIAGASSGYAHPRISTRASRFRIIEDGTEETLDTLAIHVVIVGANPAISKQYYPDEYNEEEAAAPACFSNNGVTPDPSIANPVHPNCTTCPNNAWGSKISKFSGKETKACSDVKRLAVVSADDIAGTVYELPVSPSALRNLNKYVNELRRRNIPLEGVVTKVSFDPNTSYPCLVFSFAGFLSQEQYIAAKQVVASDVVKEVTRVYASLPQTAQQLPQPKAAQQLPQPQAVQPLPQPQTAQTVENPAPQPAQRFAQQPVQQPVQQPTGLGKRRGRPPKNAQQTQELSVQTAVQSESAGDDASVTGTASVFGGFDLSAFEEELRQQLAD